MDFQTLGKILILLAVALAVVGGLVWIGGMLGLGRLPGDIHLSGRGWNVYLPIVSGIVLSIVLTVLLNLLLRFFGR